MKFGHAAISVKNVAKSVAFYRTYFGLRCSEKYAHKEIGLKIAMLKKGDIALELFEFKKHKTMPKYRRALESDLRTLGVKHFSFEVKDIQGAYRRFKRTKVPFATDMRLFDNGKQYFFIKDPDGILVEIMES